MQLWLQLQTVRFDRAPSGLVDNEYRGLLCRRTILQAFRSLRLGQTWRPESRLIWQQGKRLTATAWHNCLATKASKDMHTNGDDHPPRPETPLKKEWQSCDATLAMTTQSSSRSRCKGVRTSNFILTTGVMCFWRVSRVQSTG